MLFVQLLKVLYVSSLVIEFHRIIEEKPHKKNLQ